MEQRKAYDTDITDEQWKETEPLYAGMRKQMWPKRELTNAVLYINKTGCQWRNLPHDFPPYKTVSSFYRRAKNNGLWDKILEHLVKKVRVDNGKKPTPSYSKDYEISVSSPKSMVKISNISTLLKRL